MRTWSSRLKVFGPAFAVDPVLSARAASSGGPDVAWWLTPVVGPTAAAVGMPLGLVLACDGVSAPTPGPGRD